MGVNGQEIIALFIVGSTAAIFVWRLVRPRHAAWNHSTCHGCPSAGASVRQASVRFHARKNEPLKIITKI